MSRNDYALIKGQSSYDSLSDPREEGPDEYDAPEGGDDHE